MLRALTDPEFEKRRPEVARSSKESEVRPTDEYLQEFERRAAVSVSKPPAWRKPFADFYADQLAQTRLAEDLGYDEIWLTEHHFARMDTRPAILPIASAIAALTKRIRIGTYLVLLPLHNAVRVAEDAATVDIISNGRLRFGRRSRIRARRIRGLRRRSKDSSRTP